jgi:cell division protein FtsB
MPLTNAERQRLYRERRQRQIAGSDTETARLARENTQLTTAIAGLKKHGSGPSTLSEQQRLDRAALIAEVAELASTPLAWPRRQTIIPANTSLS